MKTSTKILLGLLIVLFLIPTVFFAAFSYKVKHTDLKPFQEASNWNRTDIGPARFIKISAPDKDVLDCTLTTSDDPHYMTWKYGQGGEDSVQIRTLQDTLFVSYVSINDKDGQHNRSMELFVQDWENLEVNGATVTLKETSGKKYAAKQVTVSAGNLFFGQPKEDDEQSSTVDTTGSSTINSLQLNATNSDVVFSPGINLSAFQVAFHNGKLTIKKGVDIGRATGSVSDDSHLDIEGAHFNKLSGLVVKE